MKNVTLIKVKDRYADEKGDLHKKKQQRTVEKSPHCYMHADLARQLLSQSVLLRAYHESYMNNLGLSRACVSPGGEVEKD